MVHRISLYRHQGISVVDGRPVRITFQAPVSRPSQPSILSSEWYVVQTQKPDVLLIELDSPRRMQIMPWHKHIHCRHSHNSRLSPKVNIHHYRPCRSTGPTRTKPLPPPNQRIPLYKFTQSHRMSLSRRPTFLWHQLYLIFGFADPSGPRPARLSRIALHADPQADLTLLAANSLPLSFLLCHDLLYS